MRWCCGSGSDNNKNDSSPTLSTANNKNKHSESVQPSTMMTEMSLKSGKNISKLSKNRSEKKAKKSEETSEKHCVLQQSDDELQVKRSNASDEGAQQSQNRPGVLKSSLKLLQSRNAPKSKKGVQYADEVHDKSKKSDEEMEESELEETRLLRDAKDDDEKMDVSGKKLLRGRNEPSFPQQNHQQQKQNEQQQRQAKDDQKKVSVESDAKKETDERSFGEFHTYSVQSPTLSKNFANIAGRVSANPLLKSQHFFYDKYGSMLVKTYKTALFVDASTSASSLSSAAAPSGALPPFTEGVTSDASYPQVLENLQRAGWTIFVTNRANCTRDVQARRPVVVIVDEHVEDFSNFINLLRSLPECEDLLVSALFVDESSASKFSVPHHLLYSSCDISLCELFARMISRLRTMPALFAVIEEAEQPIKICDENNIAQYVNRAYEFTTGRLRSEVLGLDATETRDKTVNNSTISGGTLGTWSSSSALLPPISPFSSVNRTMLATTHAAEPTYSQQNDALTAAPSASALISQRHSLPTSSTTTTSAIPASVTPISHPGTAMCSIPSAGAQPPAFLTNRRRSSEWHCITVPSCSTINPQFVYVKRGSADAIARDPSLKSLRSQTALVEAPITEALNVLDTVLHRCAEDEATQMQIRDAIKILSTAELYAPTITRFRDNDRIASGYYDGLIRLHHPSRQRKRSVVDAFRENHQRRVSAGSNIFNVSNSGATGVPLTAEAKSNNSNGGATRRRISADVVNALENESSWHFDVIELERITEHRPLCQLGIKVFERWDVANSLHCSPDILARWLQVIEANYQSGNAYHNSTHAADVLQATSFFLNSDTVGQYVQDQHALSALIAATVHDLDHPGRGNAFLMNTRSRLAVLYNDHSVLENHHVALAFQLTLTQPGVNIFARMPSDEFAQLRQATIDMVLATDMSRHFEYLTKFQQSFAAFQSDLEENRDANSLTICRMMVKCADIANPTREWKLCYQWAMRIVVEYFEQTAEETEKKLPVTMKGFDSSTCNIPLTQCTFVDMFAREAFTSWCEFAELPQLLTQLEANYEQWKTQAADWDPKQNANILQRRQGLF